MILEVVVFLVKIAVSCVDTYMIFMYFGEFYELRCKKKFVYLSAMSFLILLWICSVLSIVFINLIASILATSIIVFSIYKGRKLTRIVNIFLYYLIMISSEAVAYFITRIVYEVPALTISMETIYNIPTIIVAKMIHFILLNIMMRFSSKEEEKILLKDFIIVLLITTFSIIITITLYLEDYVSGNTKIALNIGKSCGLLFMVFIVYYLFKKSKKFAILEQKQALINLQKGIEFEKYREIEQIQHNIKIMWHDINNHLECIKNIILTNENSAKEYLNEIEKTMNQYSSPLILGNTIVEAVLYSKINKVREMGISLDIKLNIDKDVDIGYIDLCSIFSNSLDNAIEASSLVDGRKHIKLVAVQKFGFLLIKVSNTALDGGKKDLYGNIVTKKDDRKRHGLGLKSINDVVEKYGGSMETFFDKGQFELSILLNI